MMNGNQCEMVEDMCKSKKAAVGGIVQPISRGPSPDQNVTC